MKKHESRAPQNKSAIRLAHQYQYFNPLAAKF